MYQHTNHKFCMMFIVALDFYCTCFQKSLYSRKKTLAKNCKTLAIWTGCQVLLMIYRSEHNKLYTYDSGGNFESFMDLYCSLEFVETTTEESIDVLDNDVVTHTFSKGGNASPLAKSLPSLASPPSPCPEQPYKGKKFFLYVYIIFLLKFFFHFDSLQKIFGFCLPLAFPLEIF